MKTESNGKVRNLDRLLRPRSVAVVGGGWADRVVEANRKLGFPGQTYLVHPQRAGSDDRYYASITELPTAPDCAFLGIRADATVAAVKQLRDQDAGACICFASGFSERGTELGEGLSSELSAAASGMPFLGPNCFGFVNYLDRVALWPDQLAGQPVSRGVALICQSGAIAFTLMNQQRELPISYIITVGNQLDIRVDHLIEALAADERVSAIGMYVEGVPDVQAFADAVAFARTRGVPVALVKSGRSDASARVTKTHTGSLSGSDFLHEAFFERLGIPRCNSLAELAELLKLLHVARPVPNAESLVIGCSGGDMAMSADIAELVGLPLPDMEETLKSALKEQVGPDVTYSNPFDFQTFIWPDKARLESMFRQLLGSRFKHVAFVVDHPDPLQCDIDDYAESLRAFLRAFKAARDDGIAITASIVVSLPETLPAELSMECLAAGVTPLRGLPEALNAIAAWQRIGTAWNADPEYLRVDVASGAERTISEAQAKGRLSHYGIAVPKGVCGPADHESINTDDLAFPLAAKVSSASVLHKSDIGGVFLNIKDNDELQHCVRQLSDLSAEVLIEEMVTDSVAEFIIGVDPDPQFGHVLIVGSGGILTELVKERVALLFPFSAEQVRAALQGLKSYKLLEGFRGKPAGDVEGLVDLVCKVGEFVRSNRHEVLSLELNPVMVRPTGKGVVAVDAVIGLSS